MPPQPPPDNNAAETARIRAELEAESKRRLPIYETKVPSSGGGMAGWLAKNKIVQGESQANLALLGVAVLSVVLTGVIIYLGLGGSKKPVPTNLLPPQVTGVQQQT